MIKTWDLQYSTNGTFDSLFVYIQYCHRTNPIQLGYYEPPLVRYRALAKIRTDQILSAQVSTLAIVVRPLGSNRITRDGISPVPTNGYIRHCASLDPASTLKQKGLDGRNRL